jgi:hypothetical protein
MEALCACAVAALTVYDMAKAYDKGIVIKDCVFWERGGQERGLEGISVTSGRIFSINISPQKKSPKSMQRSGRLVAGVGLEGCSCRPGTRQVSLLSIEDIEKFEDVVKADGVISIPAFLPRT